MFILKGIMYIITFIFIGGIFLLFKGCRMMNGTDYKTLDEKSMAKYLSSSYGGEFEVTGSKPYVGEYGHSSDTVYTVRCSDGTEFSVWEERWQGMFGGHEEYSDDYLVQKLYADPALYSELTDCGFVWEKCKEGFIITPRSIEDIEPATKLTCQMIRRCGEVVPNITYSDPKIVYSRIYPGVTIAGTERNDGPEYSGTLYYSKSGSPNEYDAEELAWFFGLEYADKVRNGSIDGRLSGEMMKKYPPEELFIGLLNTGEHLYRNSRYESASLGAEKLSLGKAETAYCIPDYCDACRYEGEKSFEKEPHFNYLARFAKCAGYTDIRSRVGHYTLSNGKNKVELRVSQTEECWIKKDGKAVELQGYLYYDKKSHDYIISLTTTDFETLFDVTFDIDYVNAEAKMMKK